MPKIENKNWFRMKWCVLVSIFIFIFLISSFVFFSDKIYIVATIIKDAGVSFASVILSHNFKTVDVIKSRYDGMESKVRVMLVPGHEPAFGGAEYGKLKERDMNVELGQHLKQILESDSHYEVIITRDTKDWNPIVSSYYKNNWNEIVEWVRASKKDFSRLVSNGLVTKKYSTVTHNEASKDVAVRLYGLTKWANENDIDIVIHIHFNDNRRRNVNVPGKYSGFSMYVPDSQYGNSTTTKAIADNILKRLSKYSAVSDLPGETDGIIDEPELIAIGSNNTSDAPSMLIEYGYIYEPQFETAETRGIAIKDLAYHTYLGLQDFFGVSNDSIYDTLILPYSWKTVSLIKLSSSDVFALQSALMFAGAYPPNGKTKNECPRTGKIGSCTLRSLEMFQKNNGIIGEDGVIGKKTIEMLKNI